MVQGFVMTSNQGHVSKFKCTYDMVRIFVIPYTIMTDICNAVTAISRRKDLSCLDSFSLFLL